MPKSTFGPSANDDACARERLAPRGAAMALSVLALSASVMLAPACKTTTADNADGGADAAALRGCADLRACAAKCAAGDAVCVGVCRDQTTARGRALFDATAECAKGCADEACAAQRCPAETAACVADLGEPPIGRDSGADDGSAEDGQAGGDAGLDPNQDLSRDLIVVAFQATAQATDISKTDPYCFAGTASASATFAVDAAELNQKVGELNWYPTGRGACKGSFDVIVKSVTSASTVSGFTSKQPTLTVACAPYSYNLTDLDYRLEGEFFSLSGNVTLHAGLPGTFTAFDGNGCDNQAPGCLLAFGFSEITHPHFSQPISIETAFSGKEFDVPFSGTAANENEAAGPPTYAGTFTWSGRVRLKAVPHVVSP